MTESESTVNGRSNSDASRGAESFDGEILVGSRIIDDLSSGLYNSPASCLKELVNNSYDADATVVEVLIKPDAEFIAIEDNGCGMSKAEFSTHFSRISESHKREGSSFTPSGRPKIGKIGIGFIAANELCDRMEIHSTKEGSRERLVVTIDFEVMRTKSPAERKEGAENYKKGDYSGVVTFDADPGEHYTKIYLKDVRESAREIMAGAEPPREDMAYKSFYGLKPETIADNLAHLKSWSELDEYSKTMLGVALNVPVAYPGGWLGEDPPNEVLDLADHVTQLRFSVNYDGTPLYKPIVLRSDARKSKMITRPVVYEGKNVSLRGYFHATHGMLRPEDLNGVLIRIRNAAVGEYIRDFLGYPSSTGQLFQRWVSAEIYVDDRLEDALNIDRRTLRETHDAYVELREWLHDELSAFIKQVRRELYSEPSKKRSVERGRAAATALAEVASLAENRISVTARNEVVEATLLGDLSPGRHKSPRTFSVAEVFEMAIKVAADTLPRPLAEAYIAEFSRRMKG
ncbi:ATP-binding protein [Arthrobacter sp. KBS0702]|uniref:ATP-binding protein n=1 Tax=Arthrobacter sp. KBS0702 TaxID=2578107 RepID=UPI001643DFF4|nr:ATP-binding protein [Arthrobacter sp. KBS0702]